MKFKWIVPFFLCATAFAEPELFESIAAIVDGKPIMRSEVMGNLYQFQN